MAWLRAAWRAIPTCRKSGLVKRLRDQGVGTELTEDLLSMSSRVFSIIYMLAERVGFEPTVEFPLHTLSKRAPSTTRTSLRSSVRLRGRGRFGETSRRSP